MKHFIVLLLTAVGIAIGLASCQKAPELTLTGPASLEISADGGSNSITFTANRDWSVRSSDSWVSVSPSSGTASDGTVTVSIRCSENTTYEDRSATITITMEELTQTVTVKQPANLEIVIPTQSFNLASDARSIEVEVQSNIQYTVSISDSWIKQTGTKGLTTNKLTFSVDENTTYEARSATITIKPQNATVQEQVISVKQAQKDALTVEKTNFDMPYGGGEIEVKVEANVSFDVKPSVDWIHYVETKALNSSSIVLRIDENKTFSAREGKIEIAQKSGSLSILVTVKQNEHPTLPYFSFTAQQDECIVKLTNYGGNAPAIHYSHDQINWTEWDYSSITLNKGEKVYLKSTGISNDDQCYSTFVIEGPIAAEGNILALLFGDAFLSQEKVSDYCFYRLFKDCSSLTSAPSLPASILAQNCYREMFEGCTSLVNAPELPSIKMEDCCYMDMFRECVNLTRAPELPACSLAQYCYCGMFVHCESLSDAPNLPAKELAQECYNGMFAKCTSLTTAPELPALTLSYECYAQMFDGCTSLITPPALHASSLEAYCYRAMFQGCIGLKTAPALPATTLAFGCYQGMFSKCTGLLSAPELPATDLADRCYKTMFYGCTSLTGAPELPALKLYEQCYEGMFWHCENLAYIKMMATDVSANSCLNNWVLNVSTNGAFVKNVKATWDITGSSGIPNGWTITYAEK